LSVALQPRPGGKAWVELQIATPLNLFSVAFPPEQARELGVQLPSALIAAAEECDRVASGIILSTEMPEGLQ
jgi:hypothetical protein